MRNIIALTLVRDLPEPTSAGPNTQAPGRPDRRWLPAIGAMLIAAHRARQAAAVDRALRHGLAAID
jgi:hypothetical protein